MRYSGAQLREMAVQATFAKVSGDPRYDELVRRLQGRFPGMTREQIDARIRGLMHH